MEILQENYVKLIQRGNSQLLIISSSGGGKSIAEESIVEEKHDEGYLVICPFDPKDEFELPFAMFEPEAKYHLNSLYRIGKPKSSKPVKIYHPFTFDLPRTELPDMNIFTLAINELGRDEISFITESQSDLDIVRDMLNAINSLGKNDSVFDLVRNIQKGIKGKKITFGGKQIAVADMDNFGIISGSSGTQKTVSDVASYFKPFQNDYCLAPENFKLNLDIREILKDQEHYHCFSTKWIKDEKIKYFVSFRILNLIWENIDLVKYPIVLPLPEIGSLLPYKPEAYKKFLALSLSPKLQKIRSKGRGVTTIMSNQVWVDLDESVKGKGTDILFGKIKSIQDIERISKALKYNRDTIQQLRNLDAGEFLVEGKEMFGSFKIFMPSHMHKEEKIKFVEMYKKKFPEKMRKYTDLIAEVAEHVKQCKKGVREEVQKDIEEFKKRIEEKEDAEEEKKMGQDELEKTKEKLTDVKEKERNRLMNESLRLFAEGVLPNGKKATLRAIGEHLGIDHKTVKNYIEKGKNLNKERDIKISSTEIEKPVVALDEIRKGLICKCNHSDFKHDAIIRNGKVVGISGCNECDCEDFRSMIQE